MRKFIEVVNGTATDLIVAEGGAYKGKRYGKNSPDSTYIGAGLYPLTERVRPDHDVTIEALEYTDSVSSTEVVREYSVVKLASEFTTTVKYVADASSPLVPTGYLVNGEYLTDIGSGDTYEVDVNRWLSETHIIGTPASEDYQPQIGTPASEDYDDTVEPIIGTPPSLDYQPQVGTPASVDYEEVLNVPDEAFSQEELLAYQITLAKNGIDSYIYSEVSRYNKENNVDFGSIHNVASYINTPTYTHYNWCVAVWDWNVQVWETARAIQGEVFADIRPMLTLDELLAELPVFTYTA